jgi:hypothetical protein
VYYSTILDDYSGYSIVTPLVRKSDVNTVLINQIKLFETQLPHKVKVVRSDNGGEYVNKVIEQFYSEKGIIHQTTNPYSPQQNGRAERLNRTLNERARAMLLDSALPHSLWHYAIMTAAHIRNRSPTKDRNHTPAHLLFGSIPSVLDFRVFGAVAHVLIPEERRSSKLNPVAQSGRMVGYGETTKGWLIYLPALDRVVTSRDVSFNETAPATQTLPSPSTPLALPTPPATLSPSFYRGGGEDVAGPEERSDLEQIATRAPAPIHLVKPSSLPTTYKQAMSSPEATLWRQACDEELSSLKAHGTWTLVPLPPGARPLPVQQPPRRLSGLGNSSLI